MVIKLPISSVWPTCLLKLCTLYNGNCSQKKMFTWSIHKYFLQNFSFLVLFIAAQRWRFSQLKHSAVIALEPGRLLLAFQCESDEYRFASTIMVELNIFKTSEEWRNRAIANGRILYSYCIGTCCFVRLLQWQTLLENGRGTWRYSTKKLYIHKGQSPFANVFSWIRKS